MLYTKNGVLKDSKTRLDTEDGRSIFNPSPEDWLSEGWKEYVPQPVVEESLEITLEEERENLLADAENFHNSIQVPISSEERIFLRFLVEDLLEDGQQEQELTFNGRTVFVDLKKFLAYLKKINLVEHQHEINLHQHLHEIKLLESKKQIARYDYTTGYDKFPRF